jgi:hypothetical protein
MNPANMRRDAFVEPTIDELDSLENTHLIRSLGLLLKGIDENKSAIYGIEIKSNGSERSSRIPLVRSSDRSISIWKITNNVDSLEKSVVVLNDLFNFLKEHSENLYTLPKKVIVLKNALSNKNNFDCSNFIENVVSKNDIKLISFDFLKSYIQKKKSINLDSILERSEKNIFTKI